MSTIKILPAMVDNEKIAAVAKGFADIMAANAAQASRDLDAARLRLVDAAWPSPPQPVAPLRLTVQEVGTGKPRRK